MTNLEYLIKLKSLGLSNEKAALKMGLEEAKVEEMWNDYLLTCSVSDNGYPLLIERFTKLCLQYESLGESLKGIAMALSDAASHSEIRSVMVEGDVNASIVSLMKSFIILRRVELFVTESNDTPSQGN